MSVRRALDSCEDRGHLAESRGREPIGPVALTARYAEEDPAANRQNGGCGCCARNATTALTIAGLQPGEPAPDYSAMRTAVPLTLTISMLLLPSPRVNVS